MNDTSHGANIRMVCGRLDRIQGIECPPSFSLRWFRDGDVAHWLRIHRVADVLDSFPDSCFAEQFAEFAAELSQRQCYLCHEDGEPIGTATAWLAAQTEVRNLGRIHWVAIEPKYQGRGLAKPLFAAVCRRLVELGHTSAYLTTSTLRIPAVNLYFKFGFVPDLGAEGSSEAWSELLNTSYEGNVVGSALRSYLHSAGVQ